MAIHGLVDAVVEDFPDEMVQASGPDAADVHTRSFSNGLQALQDGNIFGVVFVSHFVLKR
jgi:hypothetical protein